eukprot:TRINITY_DN112476_c0_g1_i1.p1 TRINITY_DN112476_c0_g1~~TRINITY_DN112476_c0_g1_i1.p1  ORF type:complete len:508 (-),score=163.77 TRINITY_DN112476_c0_g1_i1:91-1614(-)
MGAALTYLDEPEKTKEVEDGEKSGLKYGVCEMQGWRRNMEDAHISIADFDKDVGLFAVFDGHGGKGVSKFAKQHLPRVLKENAAYKKGDYQAALEESFMQMDVLLREERGRQAVRELDASCPSKKAKPILLPRGIVARFMGGGAVPGADDDDDDLDPTTEGGPAKEGEDAGESGDKAGEVSEKVVESESTATAGAEEGAAKEAEAADDDDEGEETRVEDILDGNADDIVQIDPSILSSDPTPEAQGCTAVVVLVVKKDNNGGGPARLICANAGDSRAVLSRRGAAVALSEDHKPENESEQWRIRKAGGYVQMDAPGGPRVQGDLNLSRAFGDLRYKTNREVPHEQQILTAFPEVRSVPLKDAEDEFMVLGCDGIWECLSNQGAVDFVRPRLQAGGSSQALSAVCAAICDNGLCPSMDSDQNPGFDGHGCDNMTVVVVQLKSDVSGEVDDAIREEARRAEKTAGDAISVPPWGVPSVQNGLLKREGRGGDETPEAKRQRPEEEAKSAS